MANNNNYDGTTKTLSIKDTSYENVIYQPTKPVLDSELNFMTDLSSAKLQDMVRSKIPSGWLDANFSKGYDDLGDSFGINSTSEPNTFIINSLKQTPMLANVNGWLIQVGGTGISGDNKIKIVLGEAPSASSRSDLVFLEVWKVLLESDSSDNKPSVDEVWKFGNTQYAEDNLPDEIINETMNFETTKRVQIQYRLRIIEGPDFANTPEGIDDENTVNAQGAQGSVVAGYPFVNAGEMWDDYGLYVAGDGSETSQTDLGTVDGYVYAIPMFRIHRRNKGSFSSANQNGSAFSINSSSPSDRPDGLYQDQVDLQDIEDLRHAVSFSGFNYAELLDKTLDDLYSGLLDTSLTRSPLEGNLLKTSKGLYINRIANSTEPNTDLITKPNSQQRYYSDVAATVLNSTTRTVNNKTTGSAGSNWTVSDAITVNVASVVGRATAVVGSSTPTVKFYQSSSGPILDVVGTWSGLGTTSAEFTLGVNSPALTNQDLYISYDLEYAQKGDKLTKPIVDMLRVDDNKRNEEWGFISVVDFDSSVSVNQRRRERNIALREVVSGQPDFAYVYRLNKNYNFEGISTLYSYHINATGTSLNFIIPSNVINAGDAAYVYAVYNVDTASFISPTSIQKNVDGSITVNLPTAVDALLRFDVAVTGGVVEYDQRTQSIIDLGRVDFFKILGNGTSQVVLKGSTLGDDIKDIVVGVQTEYREVSPSIFDTVQTCYVNGIRQIVSTTVEPDTSIVTISFPFNVPTTSTIEIALMYNKTLDSTEELNFFYDYSEYKGVTGKVNFGTSSDSYIRSKIMYHRNKLDILTNGTGSINSSELLPSRYQPILSKIPLVDGADLGDFTGTVHKSKEISGGSYSLPSDYNSPYASGKENFLTKELVNQDKGTYKGGRFASSAEDSDGSVHKVVVGSLVEMVIEDGSNNFLPGELAMKVETNYIDNESKNRITNSVSGELNNSFDMFKVEGRPLMKLNSK